MNMKKITVFLLAALFLLSPLALCASAAESSEGLTFEADATYPVSKFYASTPQTVAAWIKVEKNQGRAGIILGNFGSATSCLNFEILDGGKPRLYYVDPDGTKHDFQFNQVDVRTGEWLYLAISHDEATDSSSVFVDGVLKQTIQNTPDFSPKVSSYPFCIGGDYRAENAQYFKGEIRSLTVFSQAKTEGDIAYYMTGLDEKDESLLAHYEMPSQAGDIPDTTKNGNHASYCKTWLPTKDPVTDYAYSLCVVGDTQTISYYHPQHMNTIYDWIASNAESKKMAYVLGLGDITEKSSTEEWTRAKQAIDKLNGVVPYALVRGNHDKSAGFNATFNTPEYKQGFDGFYRDTLIEASYSLFTAGKTDYLLITLDFGPTDEELAWAGSIMEKYPDRKVIVITHAYLYRDGAPLDDSDPTNTGNSGEDIWDKLLRKHENVFLVLSGHDPCANIVRTQTKGDHGNLVTQMLIDPQSEEKSDPLGMVAMLYFSEDGKTLSVEYYSTVKKQYFLSTNQFTMSIGEEEDDTVESTVETTVESESETVQDDAEIKPASPVIPIVVGVASVAVVGGAVALILVKKKKK